MIFWSTIAGEANFTMASTNLTLRGFTQPAVARSIIELPVNAEKSLSQRFIWTFPKPTYADFETLEPVDTTFTSALGKVSVFSPSKFQGITGRLLWVGLTITSKFLHQRNM